MKRLKARYDGYTDEIVGYELNRSYITLHYKSFSVTLPQNEVKIIEEK